MDNGENKNIEGKIIFPTTYGTNNIVANVDNFLNLISFKRTFPLNLIELAKATNGYALFYLTDKEEYKEEEGIIDTEHKIIAINARFKKSYICGRYIICKMIAHIALGHIKDGAIWVEPIESKRDKDDIELNPITAAFAYELLMPKKDFIAQWNNLGQDMEKISNYFGASKWHIDKRKDYLFKEENNG